MQMLANTLKEEIIPRRSQYLCQFYFPPKRRVIVVSSVNSVGIITIFVETIFVEIVRRP